MSDISFKVANLANWINSHGGKLPKRTSTDRTEKQLASFLANLRTSKKNAKNGINRKPLFWCDSYNVIVENKGISSDIFNPSTTFLEKNVARLKSILENISKNGEKSDINDSMWINNMRLANVNHAKKWNPIYQEILMAYNESASVKVRENLFTMTYQENKCINELKDILERMSERKRLYSEINPDTYSNYDYAPRNHALRNQISKCVTLDKETYNELKLEQEDASYINRLKQIKKGNNQTGIFLPVYDELVKEYGFPDLFESD